MRVEPKPCEPACHNNDAFTLSATLPTIEFSAPASCRLFVVVQSPPQWGWVKMAGQISRSLSWTVFLLGYSLTGQNWAAPLLIDRYPCSICHLDVGRDSLQCTTCLKWVHLHCSFLIHADFRTICASGTAVGWGCRACCPQSQTSPPTQTNSLITTPASPPPPLPGFPPLPPGFYQLRPHL